MITTTKHFQTFKNECLSFQNKWGLTGWELFFEHIKLDGIYATVDMDLATRNARLEFAKDWPDNKITDEIIRETAKHEMIHLILGRINCLSRARYTTEAEINEANEEATKLLEKII